MTRQAMLQSLAKLATRHRVHFCYLVLVWGFGTLVFTMLMGNWSWSRNFIQQYPDPRQLLLKRHLVLPSNHPKLSRAAKYCNLPGLITLGQEGQGSKSDNLEAVLIVTRHGDRGPLREFRNRSSVRCSVNTTLHPEYSKYVEYMTKQRVVRSSRDPFLQFQHIPPSGSDCSPGQLSAQGALQMLHLGQLLSQVYNGRWRLLSDHWLPEEVVTYSTSVTRTYQSALAFLYGFVPNFDLGKLTVKLGLGMAFCYSHQFCECPVLDKLEQQVRQERWEHVSSHPAVQDLVSHLNPYLKSHDSDKDLTWPDEVFDSLMVYACHGAPLPCIRPNSCATVDQLNNIVAFLDWSAKQVANHGSFRRGCRLKTQGFLTDVAQKFSDVRAAKRRHRVLLYSAHDVTLLPLLVSLGFFDGARVPFASRLIFELYSRQEVNESNTTTTLSKQPKKYHMRLLYNGRDVTRRTPFCQQFPSNRTSNICPLSNFLHFVQDGFLQEINATSFRQACVIPKALKKRMTANEHF